MSRLRRASTMELCVEDAQSFLSTEAYWRIPKTPLELDIVVDVAPAKDKKKKKKSTVAKSGRSTRSSLKAASKEKSKKKTVVAFEKKTKSKKVAAVKAARSTAKTSSKSSTPTPTPTTTAIPFISTADSEEIKKNLIKSFSPSSGSSGIDVVFSFDTTGSMSAYLNTVKVNLSTMVQQLLTDLPTIRIGIICHGDYCDKSNYIVKLADLTNDIKSLVSFIESTGSTGGGDEPEAYEQALLYSSTKVSWNTDHAKALVVIGDAYPHDPSYPQNVDKVDWKKQVADLASKGVKIYSVQCGNGTTSLDFFKTMADVTSGSYLELKNMLLLRDMFLGVCYREGYEMELVNNASKYDELAKELEKEVEGLGVEGVNVASRLLRPDGDKEEIAISNEDMLKVHEAIHARQSKVRVLGKDHEVAWGTQGNRYVRLHELGLLFIQQNVERSTKYSQMAREGKKITWMCKGGKWGVIVDGSFDKVLS